MRYLPGRHSWEFWIGVISCRGQFSLFHCCACNDAGKFLWNIYNITRISTNNTSVLICLGNKEMDLILSGYSLYTGLFLVISTNKGMRGLVINNQWSGCSWGNHIIIIKIYHISVGRGRVVYMCDHQAGCQWFESCLPPLLKHACGEGKWLLFW